MTDMKGYITALCLMGATLLGGLPAQAKTIQKEPDTYAYTRGVEAYNEENFGEALEWLAKELKEHPDNGYAHMRIGIIYANNDENGKALSSFDKALKYLPKKDKEFRALPHAYRSDVYLAMQDTVKALYEMNEAIKLDPENYNFYAQLGEIYFEKRNFNESDANFRRMTELDPGNTYGYMGIGRNAKEQKQWDKAIEQFTYVTKLDPEFAKGYSFRAEAYIGKEKWNEAADDLIKALDLDGDQKALFMLSEFPSEKSQILKSKLKIQMAKQPNLNYWPYCLAIVADGCDNDLKEAISWYEKANAIDANPTLLRYIAECYNKLQDYQEALENIDKAMAMAPDDLEISSVRAKILINLGRLEDALAQEEEILKNNPEYAVGYLSKGELDIQTGCYEDAIEDFNAATAVIPLLNDASPVLMKRGDAYRLAGRQAEAEADYHRIIEVEKDSTLSAGSYIQFAYSGLGDHEKAIKTMKEIIANDTTETDKLLYNLACIYARAGMKAEAISTLKESLDKGLERNMHVVIDSDFITLRDDPEYIRICDEIREGIFSRNSDSEEEGEYVTEVVDVPFTKEGGVTKVRCTINDLPLHFVFDTGAADVTISMTEANFMLKNDYIKPSDIIGSARYMDANGDITEGTVINLRKVDFGGLELDNVRASVIRNQKAPLLLGQSVLGRLGSIEIDNPGMKLKITQRKRMPR